MPQNHKYLGITLSFIGILASLLIAAFVLLWGSSWLGVKESARVYTRFPQKQPDTLSRTAFAVPTPIAYKLLIPRGWEQFRTNLVEIWLPKEFTSSDPQLLSNSADAAAPELLIAGPSSQSSPFQMFVMISHEPFTAASLDAYLEGESVKYPGEVHVVEKKKVSINARDAIRFVFETQSNQTNVRDLAYLFLDGNTVWYVEYVVQGDEFRAMLPTFESSVKTFRTVH